MQLKLTHLVWILNIITTVVLIDLMLIFIQIVISHPITIVVFGSAISEQDLVLYLMIVYPMAVIDWIFIAIGSKWVQKKKEIEKA